MLHTEQSLHLLEQRDSVDWRRLVLVGKSQK